MEEQKSNILYDNREFCGSIIRQRISDGYLNATEMCKANSKLYGHYIENKQTKEFLEELSNDIGIQISQLVEVRKGNSKKFSQGTWVHPQVAVHLAQWCSPKFSVAVSKWVLRFMYGDLSLIEEIKENNRIVLKKLQQRELEIEEKDKLLEEEREKISRLEKRQGKLESFVRTIKNLEKNQIFYLATTKNYAINNRFEYGGVKSEIELKKRIHGYNTGRAENDLMFYTKIFKCNNYKVIEDRVGNVLCQFKDKPDSTKEMVHLRYNLLVDIIEFICDNYDKEIEYVNSRCQQFLTETIEQDGIIPEEINLDEYLSDNMQIIVRRKNKEHIHKVDISDWDDEKISTTLEQIINLCATEKKNLKDYEFSKQKNSVALEITWGLLTPYLKLYEGITLMEWREKFREWFKKEKPTQLRIKGVKI